MNLAQFSGIILIAFGGAAVYLAISCLRTRYRSFTANIFLGILCTMSAIWSFGFGFVFIQSNVTVAYYGRLFGMIGTIGYLIFSVILLVYLGNVPRAFANYSVLFSLLGIPVYFLAVSRNAAVFTMTPSGMTYTFNPGIANNIYTAYSVIYAVNAAVCIICASKNPRSHREKVSTQKFLIAFVFTFLGMILDTVFPLIGLKAIPGSSLVQFIGVVILFYSIVALNRAQITDMNMSLYIYYSVSEPVLVFDNEGILRLSNKAALDFFPYVKETFDSKIIRFTNIFDLPDGYLSEDTEHKIESCKSMLHRIPMEIEVNRIRDRYNDSIGFIVTVKDMTQINEMMDSLRRAKNTADEANMAKSVFLANMSHEIRTPLNAIVGFSELLLKDGLKDSQAEQVEDIRSSAYNLLAIINDILDISKIESGRMELTPINYRLSQLLKDVYLVTAALAAKKGLTFTMEIDENIPDNLYGDIVRIRGILINILNNAVKYTPSGYVKLTGSVASIQDNEIVLHFEIADSGIGIKEEDIPKLFDSFSQVDRKKNSGIEGTGLGLAIVKGYLLLMNSSIDVKSTYGEGSTFIISLRQTIVNSDGTVGRITGASPSETAASNISDVRFDGVKVLSVDDSRMNLKLVEKSLSKYGMIVTSANSGMDAIEKCTLNEYDLILMDQMMPHMDGIETMKRIRALSPRYEKGGDCLIIVLTANAVTGVREELLLDGFDNYLSKPMDFKDIEVMFSSYVAGGKLHVKEKSSDS